MPSYSQSNSAENVGSGLVSTFTANGLASVTALTNGCVIVWIESGSATDPTKVTWGGIFMNKVVGGITITGRGWSSMWVLTSPPTGAVSAVVTYASGGSPVMVWSTYNNIDQLTPVEAFSSVSDSLTTPLTLAVTTLTANAYVVGGASNNFGTPTVGSGTTGRFLNVRSVFDAGSVTATPGSVSLALNNTGRMSMVVMALKAYTTTSTLVNNLVSFWKLNETSGDAADSKGPHTLTNTGTTPYSTGLIGNGAYFNRVTNRRLGVTTNNLGFDWTKDFSWSFWIKTNSFTNQAYVVDHITQLGAQRRFILYNNPATTQYRLFASGNELASSNLSTGVWNHFSVIKTGSNWEYFVNNVSQGTITSGAVSYALDQFCFGCASDAFTVNGDVSMDAFGMWNRALTSTEVSNLYNAGVGTEPPFSVSVKLSALTTLGVG